MSLLDGYIRDATLLGRARENDIRDLIGIAKQEWNDRAAAIKLSGAPTATRQNFAELLMPVMIADQTAVAGTAEGVLWAAMFSGLPANFFDSPGKTARLRAFGVMTTGATPGTLTLTPRYGTTTSGTSLGAGTVSGTLVASQTAVPWFIDAKCICRAIGTTGTLSFFGVWESVRGYTASPGMVEVGAGAVTTIDTTSASGGLTVGSTASNAGTSLTTRAMSIESLN